QARRLASDANFPAWHPNGSKIAFVTGPEGHRAILEVSTTEGVPKPILPSSASNWEIVRIQYSPSGAWMSFESASGSGEVLILPAGGGTPRRLIEASSYVWDSSGRHLFSLLRDPLGGTRLFSWEVDEAGGSVRKSPRMLGVLAGLLRDPALSHDGMHLAVGELEEALNLTLLPLASDGGAPAGPEQVMSRGQVIDANPVFSPDGKRIAFVSDRLGPRDIWILDLETRQQSRLQLPGEYLAVNFPAWSPDGRLLDITRFGQGEIQSIWLVASDGSHAEVLVDSRAGTQGGPFSPDGKSVLYASQVNGIGQLFTVDVARRKTRQLTSSAGDKYVGAWSPDGKWIAFSSNVEGSVQLWRMPAAGGKEERLTTGDERMRHAFYSPDGRWIYVQPSHRNLYRLPSSGGPLQPVTRFPESGLFIEEPTLSPDGRSFAYCRSNGSSSLWLLSIGTPEAGSK
ncbi:MAG TPA: hypothetical protein VGR38_13125, partial [Candidatus Polarisedimenticolia bacterium]|nr:hypothetical protein [Candidatus Polarisedimenticolia bacterium]